MINPSIRWTLLFYGALLVALGIVGYQASQSKISLMMGVISGIIMAGCSGLLFWEKRAGLYVAGVLTLVLTAIFSYRYALSHKMLPGFLAVLSGAMLFYLLSQVVKFRK